MNSEQKEQIAPRLFVIFAKEAHEAVIFRRGPSSWYHVIRWDTLHDKFFPGAWVKGRIYVERCDLSPDGKLLLYFIHQGRKFNTNYSDSWTAISHSPWLTAIGLWPQGTTYGGGGRFTDNQTAVLRVSPVKAHPDHLGLGLNVTSATKENPAPFHTSTQEVEGAEWTGRDQRDRLVYTREGKLMVAGKKSNDPICLADFNDMGPDPQPAPPVATRSLKQKPPGKKRTR